MKKLTSKRTMADVRALNRIKGFYFFDPGTMKFWHSKVCSELIKGNYFITSEDNFDRSKRLFTIREIDWLTGYIATLNGFQSFTSKDDAKEFIDGIEEQYGN